MTTPHVIPKIWRESFKELLSVISVGERMFSCSGYAVYVMILEPPQQEQHCFLCDDI